MKHSSYNNTHSISVSTTDNIISLHNTHSLINSNHQSKTSRKLFLIKQTNPTTTAMHFSPGKTLFKFPSSLYKQHPPSLPNSSFNQNVNTSLQDSMHIISRHTTLIPNCKRSVIKLHKPLIPPIHSNSNSTSLTQQRSLNFSAVNPRIALLEKEYYSNKKNKPRLTSLIKTNSNNYIKCMSHSSLLIKPYEHKQLLLKQLLNTTSNRIGRELKLTILWLNKFLLWKEYICIVERMCKCYNEYKRVIEKENTITKKNFRSFLRKIGLKQQRIDAFIHDVFNIFHYTKRNEELIEFKEVMHCLIITNTTMKYEHKIKFLCDIWKCVDKEEVCYKEVIRLIRSNLFYDKDGDKIAIQLKQVYGVKESLMCNEVYMCFIENDSTLKKLMYRNVCIDVDSMERFYNEEVTRIFHANLAYSRYMINGSRSILKQCANDFRKLDCCLAGMKHCEHQRKENDNISKALFESESSSLSYTIYNPQ